MIDSVPFKPDPEHPYEEPDDAGLLASMLGIEFIASETTKGGTTLERVLEVARSSGRVTYDFSLSQAQNVLAVCKANIRAYSNYVPGCYDGRTLVIASEETARQADVASRWKPFCLNGVTLEVIPGNHHDLVKRPHVEILAKRLRSNIETVA